MTIGQTTVGNVSNFLVPAAGQTHCVGVQGAPFTAAPYTQDWRQFQLDNFPFAPQGMYVDNTQSKSTTSIQIMPLNITITVPPGAFWAVHYPAPNGQYMYITAPNSVNTDICNIYFVDYPVIPFQISATEATGSQDVTVTGWTYAGNIPVQPTPLAAGNVPSRVQEYVPQATSYYLSGTGAIAPGVANQNLRKLKISLSGDASLAAAGLTTLTVQANAVTIFERTIYLPAAAPATPSLGFDLFDESFDIGIPMAAGTLTLALSTALTSGKLETNAYFTPQ